MLFPHAVRPLSFALCPDIWLYHFQPHAATETGQYCRILHAILECMRLLTELEGTIATFPSMTECAGLTNRTVNS